MSEVRGSLCIIYGCVLHCKDTKLKAIHNGWNKEVGRTYVVFYTAKIQN